MPQHDSLPLEGSEVFEDVASSKTTAVTSGVFLVSCDLGSRSALFLESVCLTNPVASRRLWQACRTSSGEEHTVV